MTAEALCPPSRRPPVRPGWAKADRPRASGGFRWSFFARRGAEEPSDHEASPTARDRKMARLEAVLLIADGALSTRRLAQLATLIDAAEATRLIESLNGAYDAVGSTFRVERVASGYQLLTRPELAPWLDKLHRRHSRLKLSAPSMETLAIVAYRQPITRADIEAVRGVQSAEMLKHLMQRGLVRIVGNDDSLGRPYLYGTTREFLELFGLRSLDDLPMAEKLRKAGPDGQESRQSEADESASAQEAEDAGDASPAEGADEEPPAASEAA